MGKQIGHLGGYRHLRGYAELLGSKDEQSLHIAQAIMLVLSQDKRTLFSELENLSAKSFKGLKELKKLKTYNPIAYLSSVNLKQLIPVLVNLRS